MATRSLTQIVTTLGATAALVTAIFAIDARYTKDSDLQSAKNEIIRELRTEVTKNRSVMIDTIQREADDLEYQIQTLQEEGQPVPRHLLDKQRTLERTLETLENDEVD